MGINKVVFGERTLIDLTTDTITADELRIGYTAHTADGATITGTLNTAALEPTVLNCGWVGTGNGLWTYENPTQCYSDMYEVYEGHKYLLTLGATVGTRFRVIFSTEDISAVKSGTVQCVAVNTKNLSDPPPYISLNYTPETDGYLIIQKDNAGNSSTRTYLYDTTASWL